MRPELRQKNAGTMRTVMRKLHVIAKDESQGEARQREAWVAAGALQWATEVTDWTPIDLLAAVSQKEEASK